MIRSFKIEEEIRLTNILNEKLNQEFHMLEKNGWKILNVSSFESKIWDYPEYKPAMCFIIIAEKKENTEEKINSFNDNNKVYYKIYYDNKFYYIISLQLFDEEDYDSNKFLKNKENGEDYVFDSEEDAKLFIEKITTHNNEYVNMDTPKSDLKLILVRDKIKNRW